MKKILLIEDNQFISDIYKRVLTEKGYELVIAGTGEEGLIEAEKTKFDIILLDIMLPKMDGIEVLEALKKNDKTKNIPVCMLTNLGQDAIMEKAQKLGAIGFMIKSRYIPDQIVEEVENMLNKSH